MAITEAIYREMCAWMEEHAHVTITGKDDQVAWRAFAAGLDAVNRIAPGILGMTGDEWLHQFATTLGTWVSIPAQWAPQDKATVLVHQVQHAKQFQGHTATRVPPGLGMAWLYLVEPEARLRLEVEAERARMEIEYLLTGQIPALPDLAHLLEVPAYRFTAAHQVHGQALLESAMTTLTSLRIPSTEAAMCARDFFREKYPAMLAVRG